MQVAKKIKVFLNKKIEIENLKVMHIAQGSNLSNDTIRRIIDDSYNDVSFKTILRLANFFNCSTDEIIGRDKFKNTSTLFEKEITSDSSMIFIKNFIKNKMEETGLDVYKFAENCGLHKQSFVNFIKKKPIHKSVGGNHILAVIDTFDVSLDELIGRSKPIGIFKDPTISHDLNTPSNNNKPIPQKDPSDHFKSLEKIQETLEGHVLTNDKTSHTHQTSIPKLSTKHKNNPPLR